MVIVVMNSGGSDGDGDVEEWWILNVGYGGKEGKK